MGAEGHRYSLSTPPLFFLSCSLLLSLLFDNFRRRGLPQLHNWKVSRHCVCYFRQSLGYAAEMGSFPASCSPADLFRQPGMFLPGRVAAAPVKREKPIMVALWGWTARCATPGRQRLLTSPSFNWLEVKPSYEERQLVCRI